MGIKLQPVIHGKLTLWLRPQGWLIKELSFWKQCCADRSLYMASERHVSTVCSTDSHLSAMWHLITHPAYDPLTSDAFLYLAQCNGRKLLWSGKMQQEISVEVSASVYHLINLLLPVPAKNWIFGIIFWLGRVNRVNMKSISKERGFEKWVLGFELFLQLGSLFS